MYILQIKLYHIVLRKAKFTAPIPPDNSYPIKLLTPCLHLIIVFNNLDVRPKNEYRAGHIPGALSVPLDQLKKLLDKLPKNQEIVAYCRGPYCVLSVVAVELLRKKRFKAIRLEEGIQDWRAMGLTVDVGD